MLSLEDAGLVVGVHVTSDLLHAWEGTVRWSLETLDGDALEQGEETVHAAPLANTHVITLDFAGKLDAEARRNTVLVAELWQSGQLVARKLATFVPNKHLELTAPHLDVAVSDEEGTLRFDVSAVSLARFVELSLEGADAVFSDNYFDVPFGRTVTVTCPTPEGWNVIRAQDCVRARSLYESFA